MELDPVLINLLQEKAPRDDIEDEFVAVYGADEVAYEPYEAMVCFAVHYRHEEFLDESIYFTGYKYNPLITLVCDRNLDFIEKFLGAFGCFTEEEGYGKIVDGDFVHEELSVSDIILEHDDIEVLKLVFHYYCWYEHEVMIQKAKKYHAIKCLDFLSNFEMRNDPEALLIRIISSSCTGNGKVTPMVRGSAIHLWTTLQFEAECPERQYLSSNDEQFIKQLLSSDEEMTKYCKGISSVQRHKILMSGNLNARLDLHSKLVLDCSLLLFSQLKVQNISISFHIPEHPLLSLMKRVYNVSENAKSYPGVKNECFATTMNLLNMLIKLFLQAGIKPLQETVVAKSWIDDEKCNLAEYLILNCINNMAMDIFEASLLIELHNFVMILLAYGFAELTEVISNDLFNTHSKRVITAHICVSMMTHSGYEAYRKLIREKKARLVELQHSQNNEDSLDVELRNLKTAISNSYDLNGPRSLKELSRLNIYAIMPKGKLPILVQQLDISKDMKNFLSLGVKPLA